MMTDAMADVMADAMAYMMADAGMQEVDTYVACHQNTVAQYISNRTIMDLCLASEQRPGTRVSKQWWEHDFL